MSAETLAALAVALGAGWASGLNTYAAMLVLGAAQHLGFVTLPHDLQVLASPWVMGAAAILFALNFFADKIPYIDSINDMLQTFVRVPAGALLAYGAAGGLSPEVAVIAGLLGGTLSALDGIGPDELNIAGLVERVKAGEVREVIVATNATVDGQTTAHYLAERLSELGVPLTRLAHGVPVGGELDWLDDGTLATALKARRAL